MTIIGSIFNALMLAPLIASKTFGFLADLKPSDWVIAAATLISPAIAVQVQKWIERARDSKRRREGLFESLMATRTQGLSFEHTRALNMIDIVFAKDRHVTDAWHAYFEELSEPDPQLFVKKAEQRASLFVALLQELAKAAGYKLPLKLIERGHYSPRAYYEQQNTEQQIRTKLLQALNGQPLRMEITSFPVDQRAMKAQIDLQHRMAKSFNKAEGLRISLSRRRKITYSQNWK